MMQLLGVPGHRLLQNHLPTPRHRGKLATSWVPHVWRVRSAPGLNPGTTRPEAEDPSRD
jgi:hypothetical protein